MNILKVKIPVGSDGLVKKIFLANPSGEKGVGCAGGCIKIELGKNMMDQIRSFKASMNREYPFEYSRTHLPHGKIPVDIIPGKTDPYLIVDKSGDIFWVGGVDPTKLWTPGGNTKGQYIEIKGKDGAIESYKLDVQLGQIVPPDSEFKTNADVVASNSTVDEKKPLYPDVPAPTSSTYPPINGGKSKKRHTRRFKKKRKRKKKQTKKRKKKRRTKKRYKRRKKKSVRKRGKKKN